MACLGCHDSTAAIAHGTIMTLDLPPLDAYSGDEVESCDSCHGEDREFAVEAMHNIPDPYVSPYPRHPE